MDLGLRRLVTGVGVGVGFGVRVRARARVRARVRVRVRVRVRLGLGLGSGLGLGLGLDLGLRRLVAPGQRCLDTRHRRLAADGKLFGRVLVLEGRPPVAHATKAGVWPGCGRGASAAQEAD